MQDVDKKIVKTNIKLPDWGKRLTFVLNTLEKPVIQFKDYI